MVAREVNERVRWLDDTRTHCVVDDWWTVVLENGWWNIYSPVGLYRHAGSRAATAEAAIAAAKGARRVEAVA